LVSSASCYSFGRFSVHISFPPRHPHPLDPHSLPTRRSSDLANTLACVPCLVSALPPICSFTALRKVSIVYPIPSCDHKCSGSPRSEEHTSELQSRFDLVCRLLLEKNNPCFSYICSSVAASYA